MHQIAEMRLSIIALQSCSDEIWKHGFNGGGILGLVLGRVNLPNLRLPSQEDTSMILRMIYLKSR